MRYVSAPMQLSTKETKRRKLPTQICVLSPTTGEAAEEEEGRRRSQGLAAWRRGWREGRAKLGDVYFTTWRAL